MPHIQFAIPAAPVVVPGVIIALTVEIARLQMVPLGVLVPLSFRVRSVGAAALVGLAVSASIEFIQGVGKLALSGVRTADVNDLIANTVGTLLGWWLLQRLTRSNRPAAADGCNSETVTSR
jgi:glycopeptide antibiotics resistance protein